MTSLSIPISAAPPVQSPLSPAHLAEIDLAHARSKKIRRATLVAASDAYLSAFFTAITALSALLSPSAILLAIPLAIVTFNSFRGARRLRVFDLSAPKFLALNQLALAATLITYAAVSIYIATHSPSEISAAISAEPMLAPTLGSIAQLEKILTIAIYGGLILGTILAQGLAALYYVTRKKHLAAYLASTPPWILQLQKTKAGG